ncbi:MAG: ABC transporter substrate-binding protein [Alphaproteobacteria bacterium]
MSKYRLWRQASAILAILILSQSAAGAREVTVAITAIIEHANLDTVRDGVRDALAADGYIVGQNLVFLYETADADPAKATDIARRFAAARPDVIVAISAPAAAAVVREVYDLPVVIAAMTQASADAILSTRRRHRNIAGRVETAPYAEQLGIIAEIAPQTTLVLVPVNQADTTSQAIAQAVREAGKAMDFVIRPVPAEPGEIVRHLRELLAPNTVIFLPDDKTMDLPIEEIAALAAESGLLMVAGNPEAVARGAVATVTHDPYALGWQVGEAVSRILNGAKPRDVAIRPASAKFLILNKQAAADSGIEFAPALLERAGIVHE